MTARPAVDRIALDRRAKVRSADLMAAVARLDSSVDTEARAAIITWVRAEDEAR